MAPLLAKKCEFSNPDTDRNYDLAKGREGRAETCRVEQLRIPK